MIHLLDGVNHARPQPQDLDSSFPSDALITGMTVAEVYTGAKIEPVG